jgi:circadian clock protein KaiC
MKKITTGIKGLDEMLHGGIPEKHWIVVSGPPGSGKTILAMQFVYANLLDGKKCAFISASDDETSLMENASSLGFDFSSYFESKQLTLKKLEFVEVERGLVSDYLERLPKYIESLDVEILAIDSITEFSDLCMGDVERRGRLLHLRNITKKIGATTLLTAETAPDGSHTRHSEIDYISDGWILLRRIQSSSLSETLHVMQVIKMKWIPHSREIRAYDITTSGLEVYAKYSVIL